MGYMELFSKKLPGALSLLAILLLLSVVVGVLAAFAIHISAIKAEPGYLVATGALAGIMAIMLPALLTTIVIKAIKSRLTVKRIVFIALIGSSIYSLFVLLASTVFALTGNYLVSGAVIILGDAGIFGWWFFISKFVLSRKNKFLLAAMVQPTLNVLLYIPSSSFLFSLSTSLGIIMLKLYAGILIFLFVSYVILYFFEKPMKKSLGISGIDTMSQLLQAWLFDINFSLPYIGAAQPRGVPKDIGVQCISLRRRDGTPKVIFFVPDIHYGPTGIMGGSNFPYMLEKHAMGRYRATSFIMHGAVNEDNNPVSSGQFTHMKEALDRCMRESKPVKKGGFASRLSIGSCGDSRVSLLSFGEAGIVTMSRAPKVTEDVSPAAAMILRKLLEKFVGKPVLVDAHNSRYESAPAAELKGVSPESQYMDEYMGAVGTLKGLKGSRSLNVGSSAVEIHSQLGTPVDLAPGSLNAAVFLFGSQKHVMLQFNANNMLPSFRTAIIDHLKGKYGADAEVYTTDTHYVNTLNMDVSNVLGRHTKPDRVIPFVDAAVTQALSNAEAVSAYYSETVVRKFPVWGPNSRERITAVIESMITLARFMVPAIIVAGFIIAAWVISLL